MINQFCRKNTPIYNDYAHKHVIRDDISPQKYREFVCSWINAAGSIVSGCCGVSPEQIKKRTELK
ncbi:homocysteine S-methyltransferase family protein [Colwellia sp. MB02u-10]|uniref:homocysteine S-methyltransferase family protein n=1 Tax=Colwellia sp. MB02u-10 TaxID=2759828 RepID=UPI0015F3A3C1|nr:homocysteine S-methyltransferase family protein [Colwellia sp. MB02u-10]MBA6342481.1 homocysteine S-methyltransferase family protein [Colwellia sp. MB02u-10]